MTNNSTYRTSRDFRTNLPQAIMAAEGTAEVGFPMSGKSGVSAGAFQFDLGAREALRNRFIDIGVSTGAIKDRAEAERRFGLKYDDDKHGLGKEGRAAFLADVEAAKSLAAGVMGKPQAQALIQRESAGQVGALATAVERVCGQAGPQAQAFCNSRQGQLEIATYLHQYGADDTQKIDAYFRGETVTLGASKETQARRVRIEGNLDSQQFRNGYQGSSIWGQKSPDGLAGRHERIDRFLRPNGLEDAVPVLMNPPPAERFRGEGERAEAPADASTQTAKADDKIKNRVLGIEPAPGGGYRPVWSTDEEYEAAKSREAEQAQSRAHASHVDGPVKEQTTNIASSLAQPVAHRTQWNPDTVKIGEAIASLGVEDLPPWTRNLLGRDVLANGAKPAVMGFQRAINAATKPPRFDYRWGLGGRQGRIDVDGDLGPQTRAGFGRAVEKQGEAGFKKLYALDQFGRYVKDVDRGRAKLDDLEDAIGGTLGQAIPDAPERAQETLNMLAEDREEPGAPLKIDGWVGPKTTEAFGALLRKTGPDRLMGRFAGKDFWNDEDLA